MRHTLHIAATAFALFLVMAPGEAWAQETPPGGFLNLVTTLFWVYGLMYMAIAGAKYFKARKFEKDTPGVSAPKTGMEYFFIAGFCLLAIPAVMADLYSSPKNDLVVAAMTYLLPLLALFPWLPLIFVKSLRPLRKQGILGLLLPGSLPTLLWLYGWVATSVMRSFL